MGKTLFDYFTDDEKYPLFGLSATEELAGRTARYPDGRSVRFDKELALKCDDDLFLVSRGERLLLVEELPDESLTVRDAEELTAGAAKLPEALEGWETDLCFASGYVLTALFTEGSLTLRPSPEPVASGPLASGEGQHKTQEVSATSPAVFPLLAAETGDKRFLLRFPETGEAVFLDGRRFLLYALFRGRTAAGFVEAPPRD